VIEEFESGDIIPPGSDIEPLSSPKDEIGLVSAKWLDQMTEPYEDQIATLEAQL